MLLVFQHTTSCTGCPWNHLMGLRKGRWSCKSSNQWHQICCMDRTPILETTTTSRLHPCAILVFSHIFLSIWKMMENYLGTTSILDDKECSDTPDRGTATSRAKRISNGDGWSLLESSHEKEELLFQVNGVSTCVSALTVVASVDANLIVVVR